ncbi:PorP/SprF family type IX secretion system membrane protein [Rufibacter roseus]|uniref:PorP/SprF family type IX secretion system membrane protein n=1 Tax=Rufibacter roseus TaxID=1567108 RepID=A0ABW2DFX7_9BACT|nr:PorP/SprF family type IX secretion system membrane protein [Rufibacter roseus]
MQFTCRPYFFNKWATPLLFLPASALFLFSKPATAQSNPPVQQYAHRLFLNPAFTGLLSDYSVTAGHRSQWTGIEDGFSTQWLSGEYRFQKNKNAVGATILNDRSIGVGYSRIQVGATYAYHTKLRQNLDLSAGVQVGYGFLRPGYGSLMFEDQLGGNGQVQQPTAEPLTQERSSYLTLATGFLLFTDQFWAGASVQQLNNPSVGESSGNTVSPLLQVHTGYRFYARNYFDQNSFKEISFTPTVSYMQQSGYKRVDGAMYMVVTPFTIGLSHSYLPTFKNNAPASTISGIAGVTHKGLKLGYGYRHSLSGNAISIGPTHEISLSFEKVDYLQIFKRLGADKNYNRIACPAF